MILLYSNFFPVIFYPIGISNYISINIGYEFNNYLINIRYLNIITGSSKLNQPILKFIDIFQIQKIKKVNLYKKYLITSMSSQLSPFFTQLKYLNKFHTSSKPIIKKKE